MDPLPQQRWAGVFVTFFAFVYAACGAVRKNKSSYGAAPQCLTGPGRVDDPKKWYRAEKYTGEPQAAATMCQKDLDGLAVRIRTTKAAEIQAAADAATPSSGTGSTAAKNAAKQATVSRAQPVGLKRKHCNARIN